MKKENRLLVLSFIFLLVCIAGIFSLVWADSDEWRLSAYDYESITVGTSTAIGLTSTKISPTGQSNLRAKEAFCTAETSDIRWRADGTDPTISEGHVLASGNGITVKGYGSLAKMKMFSAGATTGTVKCTYMR